tara:strand:- start:52541 stop:52717 length:177 start_codon:yes stop_codon:yes gene_type:complete
MSKLMTILVLSDGETYTGVDGCSICFITPEQHDMLCEGSSPKDIDPVHEIGLKEYADD